MGAAPRRRARNRVAIGLLVFGLIAAACGDSDDGVVADQSDETEQELTPVDTDAASDAPPVTSDAGATDDAPDSDEAQQGPAGLPPIDTNCESLPDTDDTTRSFDAAPPMCLEEDAPYSAVVETTAGTITIDLDPAAAPITVNSFVFLARNNYFDDTVCHRIIQEFVVQCGDPTATGTGGPGYSFPDELPEAGQYELGSIAMANSGPDTNGSQFFIISGEQGAALPPLYSLFGQVRADDLGVISEMNALGSAGGAPTGDLRIQSVQILQS